VRDEPGGGDSGLFRWPGGLAAAPPVRVTSLPVLDATRPEPGRIMISPDGEAVLFEEPLSFGSAPAYAHLELIEPGGRWSLTDVLAGAEDFVFGP
jgi:hypothetical protein